MTLAPAARSALKSARNVASIVVSVIANAVLRVIGIDRHPGGSGLEHRQDRRDELEGAIEMDADERFRPDSLFHQAAAPTVRGGVELRLGEPLGAGDERGGVRVLPGAALEELLDHQRPRGRRRRREEGADRRIGSDGHSWRPLG
jgi:hypothetical protein